VANTASRGSTKAFLSPDPTFQLTAQGVSIDQIEHISESHSNLINNVGIGVNVLARERWQEFVVDIRARRHRNVPMAGVTSVSNSQSRKPREKYEKYELTDGCWSCSKTNVGSTCQAVEHG
jgi:hypothetical protein